MPYKLSDTQLILLVSAAAREDGSLLPAPPTITAPIDRIRRSIVAVIKHGLASEAPAEKIGAAYRSEGEQPLGAFITDAGRAALDGTVPSSPASAAEPQPTDGAVASDKPGPASAAKGGTKAALVVNLLTRAEGATLDELVQATGWLPHTTRAALTGLRKKGHAVLRGKRGDRTCYRVEATA